MMTNIDEEKRAPGTLAKVGASQSFAGFTRIVITLGGFALSGLIAWGRHDIVAVLDDVKANQDAIRAIGERTTKLESIADTTTQNAHEFRTWTQHSVDSLVDQSNNDRKAVDAIKDKQVSTEFRVVCLENKIKCPARDVR